MTNHVRAFTRWGLWALPIWAAMLFAGTLTHQPDAQTAFPEFAKYVTTSEFLWSHLVNSITGAAIGSVGAIALLLYLQGTSAAGRALAGMIATVMGNTMTASIFGVAAFAQPAMGRAFLAGQPNAQEFYNQVYGIPLFGMAIVSLLLFIAGGILLGMAITASGRFPRWIGWVYAITTVGFVVSNFTIAVGQTPMSALLVIATAAAAWTASRAVPGQAPEAAESLPAAL